MTSVLPRLCQHCTADVAAKSSRARYCSATCRKAAHLARARGASGAPPPTARRDWLHQAACKGTDPAVFVPAPTRDRAARTAAEDAAKNICAGCPVLAECRAWGLAAPSLQGVAGGLTETERQQERARARAAATAD